jgi:hypothetical protein
MGLHGDRWIGQRRATKDATCAHTLILADDAPDTGTVRSLGHDTKRSQEIGPYGPPRPMMTQPTIPKRWTAEGTPDVHRNSLPIETPRARLPAPRRSLRVAPTAWPRAAPSQPPTVEPGCGGRCTRYG